MRAESDRVEGTNRSAMSVGSYYILAAWQEKRHNMNTCIHNVMQLGKKTEVNRSTTKNEETKSKNSYDWK